MMPAPIHRPPARFGSERRLGPLALAIILHVIVVLLLLFQRNMLPAPEIQESLKTFFLPAGEEERTEHGDASDRPEKARAGEPAEAVTPPVKPPVIPPTPERAPDAPVVPSLLSMSSADYAATDIGKMASARRPGGEGGNDTATYGPGEGPGGVQLYNADWYRPPTDAELSFYLPRNRPSEGWGLVACRTVERFHVEDCQTIGEYPLGSGFGRAVREAAWQFLVRPPRINGRPQIGAWVRIRITYGTIAAAE